MSRPNQTWLSFLGPSHSSLESLKPFSEGQKMYSKSRPTCRGFPVCLSRTFRMINKLRDEMISDTLYLWVPLAYLFFLTGPPLNPLSQIAHGATEAAACSADERPFRRSPRWAIWNPFGHSKKSFGAEPWSGRAARPLWAWVECR